MRGFLVVMVLTSLAMCAGCDLLNKERTVGSPGSGLKPANLSKPDSVLAMLTYLFDLHTPEAATQDYGDLLSEGYVYRYVDPADQNSLTLNRASEIQVYENIFASFQNIAATFDKDSEWIEYGSRKAYPPDTPVSHVSEGHPTENWVVLHVLGEMRFTNTDESGMQVGFEVRQYFDMAFRLDSEKSDSTWQLGSWTDREAVLEPAQ